MKKVFFLIESLENSAGTERIATEVVNSLYEVGIVSSFVVLSNSKDSYYRLADNIRVHSINSSLGQRMRAIIRLRSLLKQEVPDFIVNVGIPMAQISILAALGTKTKVIGWEHFNLHAGSKLGYFWRLIAAKLSYQTVVLTQKDCLDYLTHVNANVICIPNFITRFIDVKSKLDSKIVLSVGRLTSQKGYDLLLAAWKLLVQQKPEWCLYIVGTGPDEVVLKQQAKDLEIIDSVSFIPATSEIEQYFRQASLYVMSSRFEGMPMVLLEAKMCGLPCVSFNCPNGPDEIICNNLDGFVVDFGDIIGLSKAMKFLMKNDNRRRDFGQRAKDDAITRFTKEEILKKWLILFRD